MSAIDNNCMLPKDRSHTILVVALFGAVAAIVVAVHWKTLDAQALSVDDTQYVVDNYLVRSPSLDSTVRFLREVRSPSTVAGYYQPLSMISLMLDCATGANPDNLQPFHRTSLGLHVLNTLLVVCLLNALLGNIWAAAAVGLLFGVHPMTVEPVAWVSERKTLLATFFALCSMLAYVRYAHGHRAVWFALSMLAFVLALLAKPTVTPLPVLLLLLDVWPLGRFSLRTCVEKLPFGALAAIFAAITYVSQASTGGTYNPAAQSALRVPLVLCHNIVFYAGKMLWPANLSLNYPFPEPMGLANHAVLAGVLGTCILIALVLISLRWTLALAVGWSFFFLAILPTMGIVGFTVVIAADKYAYFPVFGLLLLLVWGLDGVRRRLLDRWASPTPLLAIGCVLLAGVVAAEAAATRAYLRDWQDSVSLAQRMVRLTPDSPLAADALGVALLNAERYEEAERACRRALDLNPHSGVSLNNLGLILHREGRHREAIPYFQQALRDEPQIASTVLFNLGDVLLVSNQPVAAAECFGHVLDRVPRHEPAMIGLAAAFRLQARDEQAIATLRKLQALNPRSTYAYRNITDLLGKLNRWSDAVAECREWVRAAPQSAVAHNSLGASLFAATQPDEAVAELQSAARLDPQYVQPRFNLGTVLLSQERYEAAVAAFEDTLRLQPSYAEAHNRLGFAMEKLGRLNSAVEQYCKAVELDPKNASAAWNAAEGLSALGHAAESVPYYRRVIELQPDRPDAHAHLAAAQSASSRPTSLPTTREP